MGVIVMLCRSAPAAAGGLEKNGEMGALISCFRSVLESIA